MAQGMFDVRPDSKGNRFRQRRLELLQKLISSIDAPGRKCRLLDIGGTDRFWHTWRDEVDWTNVEITCINYDHRELSQESDELPIIKIQGDARDLNFIQNNEYDIVFSNSVIEHVGTWSDMTRMAEEVCRVAPAYLIQTPCFWFPVEPHARMLFLHWLPDPLAYRMLMLPAGGRWTGQKSVRNAMSLVQSARLLDAKQMRALFPDAFIMRERFLGFTKSLIAINPWP